MKRYPEYFDQESERLRFRAVEARDVIAWERFFHDNRFIPYLGIPPGLSTMEMAERWIEIQFERYQEFGLGHLAVLEKHTLELVGMGGILARTLEEEVHFEIAYSILPSNWGKGYATEIARQMKWSGMNLGLSKDFISIIHEKNTESMRVAEKNGMSPTRRTRYLDMDVIIYSTGSNG